MSSIGKESPLQTNKVVGTDIQGPKVLRRSFREKQLLITSQDHIVSSCEQWNREGRLEGCLNRGENLLDKVGATGDFLQSSGKARLTCRFAVLPLRFPRKQRTLPLLSQCPPIHYGRIGLILGYPLPVTRLKKLISPSPPSTLSLAWDSVPSSTGKEWTQSGG